MYIIYMSSQLFIQTRFESLSKLGVNVYVHMHIYIFVQTIAMHAPCNAEKKKERSNATEFFKGDTHAYMLLNKSST